jgi:hypothetical protein
MKRPLLAFTLFFSVCAVSHAQPERSDARQQAERHYAQMDAAINSGNMKAFLGMFLPSFYVTSKQGVRMDFRQFKEMVSSMQGSTRDVRSRTRVHNVQLQEQEVVVWIQQEMSWKTKQGRGWATQKSTSRWAETLVWSNGQWKFASSQELFVDEPWSFKTTGG